MHDFDAEICKLAPKGVGAGQAISMASQDIQLFAKGVRPI